MNTLDISRQKKRKLFYLNYEHLYQFDTKSIPNHNTVDIDFVHFNYLHSSPFLMHFPLPSLCRNHLNFLSHSSFPTPLSMKPQKV